MKQNRFKNILLICGIITSIGLIGCAKDEMVFVDVQPTTDEAESPQEKEGEQETGEAVSFETEEQMVTVTVHVCGAVLNPGVYELSCASRIMDAVNLAGGLTEEAADDYVNLAAKISDAQQIYIPTREEAGQLQRTSEQGGQTDSTGKININTADKELLCTLPGIGQTRAQSIITYRQEHGKFASIEDIMQVSGIKESSFQKIKEYITVN